MKKNLTLLNEDISTHISTETQLRLYKDSIDKNLPYDPMKLFYNAVLIDLSRFDIYNDLNIVAEMMESNVLDYMFNTNHDLENELRKNR